MPRRRAATKRVILPDPKYKDLLVSKFINSLMKHGKKSIAENIFYSALDIISERESEMSSLEIFKAAIENVMPSVEVNLGVWAVQLIRCRWKSDTAGVSPWQFAG